MKHYFVTLGEFKLPLKQYLKQQGMQAYYDGIKRKISRRLPDKIGDVVIKPDSEFLKILDTAEARTTQKLQVKKNTKLANGFYME
jgi:hypothetical protein